jgi:aryl-alcohol dehydrogenase-like predicted oxidoreductase
MALTKKKLGRTGLEVTQLGYGAMEVRGRKIWGGRAVTDQQAKTILNAVVDSGINFLDTANDYGKSEMYIGRHIADRRGDYYLATKCGCHVVYGPEKNGTPHVFTNDNLYRNIAESLMLMETEQVDLLQLHNPAPEIVEENKIVDTLKELREAGACKFIGISTTSPHIGTYLSWDVFDTFQIPYSALERTHENWITKVGEAGAGVIIRGGVAKGEPGKGQGPEKKWALWEEANLDELLEDGESRTDFMLRYTLTHPHCHTTIVGTLNPDHLRRNIEVARKGPLADDVYAEAKKRLDAAGVTAEEAD